uniref:Transglutaminase N-terminal domain-containing protein n=1 Tax=Amphilophus citrinellus TaxID=61819 RepID=A0A3Q0RAK1_AMPCI
LVDSSSSLHSALSRENNLAHRTREIDQKRLIVRRGQPFSIALECNGPLPPKNHLQLVLHLGDPSVTPTAHLTIVLLST